MNDVTSICVCLRNGTWVLFFYSAFFCFPLAFSIWLLNFEVHKIYWNVLLTSVSAHICISEQHWHCTLATLILRAYPFSLRIHFLPNVTTWPRPRHLPPSAVSMWLILPLEASCQGVSTWPLTYHPSHPLRMAAILHADPIGHLIQMHKSHFMPLLGCDLIIVTIENVT